MNTLTSDWEKEAAVTDVGVAIDDLECRRGELRFIEHKSIDWTRFNNHLMASEKANHWSNFGPVSRVLEETLEGMLSVPDDRVVVATSSATTALFGLVGVATARAGRPLRWVGGAFGHRCTLIGPLTGAVHLVDCDPRGLLDLEAVDALSPGSWDGLIVTNVFGVEADLSEYKSYCRERGKVMIADNAMCLFGFDRTSADAPDEIISFGHTKPWGFGEGGCAILPRSDGARFRNLMEYGLRETEQHRAFSVNGKLSDIGAAAILAWLSKGTDWREAYSMQAHRIVRVAERVGFEAMHRPRAEAVMGFVPLLGPEAIPADAMAACEIPLKKYYPPLADLPITNSLYQRIVCVPSHPGMAAVDDDTIDRMLRRLVSRSDS